MARSSQPACPLSEIDQTFVTVRGLRYSLRTIGPADGPPLFLLHGLLDTGASFAPLIAHLGEDYRVLAPDWRGHGDSDNAPQGYWFPDYVADLEALVSALAGDAPVRLVGHSMGGQAASLYAGLRPARVHRLALLDSLVVPATPPADIPRRYRAWLDAQAAPPAPKTYDSVATLAERIRRRYPELAAAQVEHLAEAWSKPTDDGRVQLATDPLHHVPFPYGFRPEEAMAIWREVAAPVLCLDAGDSPARKWIDADEMARRRASFPRLDHKIVPGCGHMLHLEKPAAVAAELRPFLAD